MDDVEVEAARGWAACWAGRGGSLEWMTVAGAAVGPGVDDFEERRPGAAVGFCTGFGGGGGSSGSDQYTVTSSIHEGILLILMVLLEP